MWWHDLVCPVSSCEYLTIISSGSSVVITREIVKRFIEEIIKVSLIESALFFGVDSENVRVEFWRIF